MTHTLDEKIRRSIFSEQQQLYLAALKLALSAMVKQEGVTEVRLLLKGIADDLAEFE